MKNILPAMNHLLILFISLGICASASAQLTEGDFAPNWTVTDLDGNSHTLYDYLDQGYTVFFDISATWCGPCWSFHQSGAMTSMYVNHGPEGMPGVSPNTTNTMMVFFMEGDMQTGIPQLNGQGGNTQGNWVEGSSYPIIDLPNTSILSAYGLTGFPNAWLVCPNRIIRRHYAGFSPSTMSAAAIQGLVGGCQMATEPFEPSLLSYNGTDTSCDDFALQVTIQNMGTEPLTECMIEVDGLPEPIQFMWSGILETYDTEQVEIGTVVLDGSTDIVIGVSSGSGNVTSSLNVTLNYIDAEQAVSLPNLTDFTPTGFPYFNWQLINPDNSITWQRANTNSSGGAMFINTYQYSAQGQLDHFVTHPFELTDATSPSLKFKYANKRFNAQFFDRMRVEVATNCNGPWSIVWDKQNLQLATGTSQSQTTAFTQPSASDWKSECISLSNYAGAATLYVRFTNVNGYGNNIFVDDVEIDTFDCTTIGLAENMLAGALNIFPNPATTELQIHMSLKESVPVTLDVYDMVGKLVHSIALGTLPSGDFIQRMDVSAFKSGLYLLSITAGEYNVTRKVTITK